MARAEIPVTAVTTAGIAPTTPTAGDSVNGHFVVNDGRTWLEVTNLDGSNPHTLSARLPNVDGQAVTPKPFVIAANTTSPRKIRLGDPHLYGRKVLIDADSSQLKIAAYTTGL
jgi:hypothetical protein